MGADADDGKVEEALKKVESEVTDDPALSWGASMGLGDRRGDGARDGGIEMDCPSSSFSVTNGRLIAERLVGRAAVNHGWARICGMVSRLDGSLTRMFWMRSRDPIAS